ncbi:MAG: LytTR family DNA-binding domain-containing protein [Anaerovoracaceae bacterium]
MDRMLKIAAVDDMQEARDALAEKLNYYMESRWLKYELSNFESGESFVSALEKERFDIVFMDIFMDGMTGIEAAAKLRTVDMNCKLVFLTTSRDFLEEGYGYNPCHYLLKPFDNEKFKQAMHNCQIKRQFDVPFLDIVSNGIPMRIDTAELIYVNTYGRNVQIHTTTGTHSAGRGFAGISESLLADERFLLCIKGVAVNMDFIAGVEDAVFLLKNGERLQMALRTKNSLMKQYRAYRFARAGSREGTSL